MRNLSKSKFDIRIAALSTDSRILFEGIDISSGVHAINICQVAGQLPIVTLELVGTSSIRLDDEVRLRLERVASYPEDTETRGPEGAQWP
jgi:hypothetical protein